MAKTSDLIYNELKDKLKIHLNSADTLDNKAIGLIGFTGGLITLIINLQNYFKLGYNILFYLCVVILFLSMLFSIWAYLPRDYRIDPKSKPLVKKYLNKNYDDVKEILINNLADANEANSRIIGKKGKHVNHSILCLFIALIIYMIDLLLY